jgi:hypothetical protein
MYYAERDKIYIHKTVGIKPDGKVTNPQTHQTEQYYAVCKDGCGLE